MDLTEYRISEREKERIADLMVLLPESIDTALDIGARDGFISKLLADRISNVIALDLEQPTIEHERVRCVKGDITTLDIPHESVDLVVCTEVLEHICPTVLSTVCDKLSRVSSRYLLIGVPFRQDIRVGRTTCQTCGGTSPPWGHVNSFDEERLRSLFPRCSVVKTSFVGTANAGTNAISCMLMDLAGNPYGTYTQEEGCTRCGAKLEGPPPRNLLQKALTRLAFYARDIQRPFFRQHPNWIHMLFERRTA